MSEAVLDGAALGTGEDVLVLGGDAPLVFGAHCRIGDGWVYAVDPEVDALEALLGLAHAQGVAGVAYLVGHAGVLPLPDASVAAVVGSSLTGAADLGEAAREMYRVLGAGGRLSIEAVDDGAESALVAAGFVDVVRAADADDALLTARRP